MYGSATSVCTKIFVAYILVHIPQNSPSILAADVFRTGIFTENSCHMTDINLITCPCLVLCLYPILLPASFEIWEMDNISPTLHFYMPEDVSNYDDRTVNIPVLFEIKMFKFLVISLLLY